MPRLPQPGADEGSWGNILNQFLSVSLQTDGAIKPGAIGNDQVDAIDQSKITGLSTSLDGKADDNAVVHTSGSETVAGVKTFSSSPIVPDPTSDTQAASKGYVDSQAGSGGSDKVSKSGDTMSGPPSVESENSYGALTVGGTTVTDAEGDIFSQRDSDAGATYPVFARYWDAHADFPSGTFLFGNGPSPLVGIEKPGGTNVSQFRVRATASTFNGTVGLPASGHLNFGSTSAAAGYGLRDNSGVMEYKDSGGNWAPINSGSAVTAPRLTVKLQALGNGQDYSREIPLFYDAGAWRIAEMITTLPVMADDDVLRVTFSFKEVIAAAIYALLFETLILEVTSTDGTETIRLTRNNAVDVMELYGEMTVTWDAGQVVTTGTLLHLDGDSQTIKGDVSSPRPYQATLRFAGQLVTTSGN